MEITYIQKGDYFYPNLAIDPADQVDVGKYGWMRRRYLKEHRQGLYSALWIEGKLTTHLLEINETAFAQIDRIVKQLLNTYPAPDRDADFLAYVSHMNNLTAMAEKMVLHDLIYT